MHHDGHENELISKQIIEKTNLYGRIKKVHGGIMPNGIEREREKNEGENRNGKINKKKRTEYLFGL